MLKVEVLRLSLIIMHANIPDARILWHCLLPESP